MAGKGGYQRPTSPAPVSGPGSLSQRTDGGPADTQSARYISGLPYGQGNEMLSLQQSAPMEASTTPSPASPSQIATAPQQVMSAPVQVTSINAPSNRPNEPVTHGANLGPGPGTESLGLFNPDVAAETNFRASMISYMPVLMHIASRPNTSPDTRRVIQQLRELL